MSQTETSSARNERLRNRLAAVLILAWGCLSMAGCNRDTEVDAVMGTLERDRLELVAESAEPIGRILVTEGQSVQAGEALLVQDLGPMRARMEQAQARVQEAQRNLDALVSGPRQQEIFEARAELEAADSTLMMETREYERTQDLVKRKLQSESLLDQSKAQRDNAQSSRKQATARLRLLLEGTRTRRSIRRAPWSIGHARRSPSLRSARRAIRCVPRLPA